MLKEKNIADKQVVIRMPKELWFYIKKKAVMKSITMNKMIVDQLYKLKKNRKEMLTNDDSLI